MYNTTFLCTYKLHDDEDDQDTIYRHEYLYAFGLKEYDSDKIMKTLEYIYNKLEDNVDFIEILESHLNSKYWFITHDTCEAGLDFYSKIKNIPIFKIS